MIETVPDFPALQAVQNALWHVSNVRGAAVMVGSGFSMNAELASPTSKAPPLWGHMAAAMEKRLGSTPPGSQNPLRLAEEFRSLLGQSELDGLIRDLIPDSEWLPSAAHKRLMQLPWSDVLTTNWDTLLERAALQLAENPYEVVLTPKDIARTRSPRIVKLHGSLPSHTPFIFAEEDYRTYPVKFAPFVNLAQHVLLENELLLLGFSGDDPNFLAWAGWVRDQLGMSARRIRLAGVLNLNLARRRYLENLNVTPIDLAPLVSEIHDPKVKHARATDLLLQSLHGARPKPVHVWTRKKAPSDSEWNSARPGTRLIALLSDWQSDRANAPAWLIMPHVERVYVRQELDSIGARALSEMNSLEAAQRGLLAAELAWRLEVSAFGVPEWARPVLEQAVANSGWLLGINDRLRILFLLGYQAIEERDHATVQRYAEQLDAEAAAEPEAAAAAAYLRGLSARDQFDFKGMAEALTGVNGSDPIWMLRRASLHCELCESKAAARLVRDALNQIARRRAQDRRSLWLLSREAWARFLWGHLVFELRDETDANSNLNEDWPIAYGANRTNPWDELHVLEVTLRREQENAWERSIREKTHFEPGSWTPPDPEAMVFIASWVLPVEMELRRIADFVGLPRVSASSQIMQGRLLRAVNEYDDVNAAKLWRVATYLQSENDEPINRWFGRIQIAAMPVDLVEDFIASLRSAIEFLARKLRERDAGYIHRVSRLRTLMELVSRLAVRASERVAAELVEMGTSVFGRGGAEHWWLYKSTSHLLERALSAIPPNARGSLVAVMINFPLPGEHTTHGMLDDWPELSDFFTPHEVAISRPNREWDGRVNELISWVVKDAHDSRHHALRRLRCLLIKKVLTEEETRSAADAIWGQRTSPTGLPADDHLYPGVFVELPEPSPGMAAEAFNHDIVEPLLTGRKPKVQHAFESIAYVGVAAEKKHTTLPFTSAVALELIHKMPHPSSGKMDEAVAAAIFFGLLPATNLDDTAAEQLWSWATLPEARASLLFLPAVAIYDSSRTNDAVARLRRAINSREFGMVDNALNAVRHWSRSAATAAFPKEIASAVASLIAMRREPGLFRALDVCVELVECGHLERGDLQRVLDGMAEIAQETDYQTWRPGDFRTATLTYVRANAYRLAKALQRQRVSDPAIDAWLAAGQADALPEVRFVSDEPE